MSKEQLRGRYKTASSRREYDGVGGGKEVSQMLAFMDGTIKKEFESFTLLSFSICGGDRRFKVDPTFEAAFLALTLEEQITYFELGLTAASDPTSSPPLVEESQFEALPVQITKGLKVSSSRIKLSPYILDCSKYEIPLEGYLLRRSKKNQHIFILETLIQQDPTSIRFQLIDPSPNKEAALLARSARSFSSFVQGLCQREEASRIKLSKVRAEGQRARLTEEASSSPIKNSTLSIDIQCRSQLSNGEGNAEGVLDEHSVVQEVLLGEQEGEEELYQLVQRKNEEYSKRQQGRRYRKNVAQVLLPELSLVDIDNLNEYLPVWQDEAHRLYIYQHSVKATMFMMELHVKETVEAVVRQLCEVQSYKLWNPAINESHVKLSISSDNTYLVYLKQRSLSEWFRQRDFLFLRHLCRVGPAYYLIDCSIQNPHFVPFQSIIRGCIRHAITRIEPAPQGHTRILMQADLDYSGLLTTQGKTELAVRFLQGFVGLESFISRFKGEYKCPYDLDWEICLSSEQSHPSREQEQQEMPSNLFNQHLEPLSASHHNSEEDEFYSIQDEQDRPAVVEVSEEEQARVKRRSVEISGLEEQIQRDTQGLVVLPKTYLTVHHQLAPVSAQPRRKRLPYTNLMVKNDFRISKAGGLILVNQPKIAAQDNVIKFMMSTLKKNLFSGKGILNISLPVEIFNCDSNLQRLCEGLSLAPLLLQKAVSASPLERFKYCIAFAFSNSVLYFDMEKPFNPILGETFQGFIAGCPVYAEQVSHHPPISAILMIGRGYRVHGCLQAKVYVHLNSGQGVNEGLYSLQFQDGGKVVFQTCPGEISGLAMGQRKFRFKGKSYILDAKNRLFCTINFEDETGMFSRSKWEYSDQMDGEILKVTDSFVRAFFEGSGKDLPLPAKKDIEERLGHLGGRWIEGLLIDGKEWLSVEQAPFEMVHYEYPLNSNSNYREDLFYRKLNDLARSQSEKERLEVIQRNDRKLREKYHPGGH